MYQTKSKWISLSRTLIWHHKAGTFFLPTPLKAVRKLSNSNHLYLQDVASNDKKFGTEVNAAFHIWWTMKFKIVLMLNWHCSDSDGGIWNYSVSSRQFFLRDNTGQTTSRKFYASKNLSLKGDVFPQIRCRKRIAPKVELNAARSTQTNTNREKDQKELETHKNKAYDFILILSSHLSCLVLSKFSQFFSLMWIMLH